jgi:hypothetical protein
MKIFIKMIIYLPASGKTPILSIFQPIIESFFLGKSRDPIGLFIV